MFLVLRKVNRIFVGCIIIVIGIRIIVKKKVKEMFINDIENKNSDW